MAAISDGQTNQRPAQYCGATGKPGFRPAWGFGIIKLNARDKTIRKQNLTETNTLLTRLPGTEWYKWVTK